MKTLTSLLLISATFLGVNAYAQERPGVREYRPIVSQVSSVTRVQVIREIQAVRVGEQLSFNEIGHPVAGMADDTVTLETIRVEAISVDVIGLHPSQDESRRAALNTTDEVTRGESEEAARQVSGDGVTDKPVVAEASTVDVIGIYPDGDQSYKAAFSVANTSRG